MGFSRQEHWSGLPWFWDPYNLNVGAFDTVPEVSQTIISSYHYFHFILLFRSCFHHFIFQHTDSFFCFRYSAIDFFQSIFNFSNCVLCLCMLIFNSSRSLLLIDACICSILFSRFLIIFTIIILNSFSGSLPIFSSFIQTCVFLVCSFIYAVFLCLFIFFFLTYCV